MSETLPRVGSALLVRDEANRILLGQRNKDPQRGAWVIPGGKIHAFESIAQAAAREMEEETGLKVEVQNQFGVYEIVNPPTEHRIVIYSWGRVTGGTPRASDDLSQVKFFTIDELGEVPTTPLVRKVLSDAGLVASESKPAPPQSVQLLLVPIPLAGVSEVHGVSSYAAPRRRRRRSRAVIKSGLLFDMGPGT